jgi:hypothetical protein
MQKKERLGYRLFDTWGKALNSNSCFDAVVNNGTCTILLSRVSEIEINLQLLLAVAECVQKDQSEEGGLKKRRNF